jgi:hypothetical protein
VVTRRAGIEQSTHELAFESFGVHVSVSGVSERQLEQIRPLLPPGWQECSPDDVSERFTLESDQLLRWVLRRKGKRVTRAGLEFQHALLLLESQMRSYIALNAPDLIFVHAGVVAVGERLLVIPGLSFSGKTTLVAALVRAGAVYYSDEYALLDEKGLVHAYPRPLSLRNHDRSRTNTHVGALGGVAGEEPLRISDILVTTYKPNAEWHPRRLTPGESVLALLSHTVAARSRPEQAMRHITHAVKGAVAFESERGESDEVASILLDDLRA